jgi:hypothetical protein
MSRYIIEKHRCEKPEILPSQNFGTVWECDCKRRFVVAYSHHTSGYGWAPLEQWKFNEAEDRLLTWEEQREYITKQAMAFPKPTLWDRMTWRFRR